MTEDSDLHKMLGKIDADLDHLQEEVSRINKKLDESYVTHAEFIPVRNLVYGLVGLILTSVFGTLMALVVKGGGQ